MSATRRATPMSRLQTQTQTQTEERGCHLATVGLISRAFCAALEVSR